MRRHAVTSFDAANSDLVGASESYSDFAAPAAVNSDVIADPLKSGRTLPRSAPSIPMASQEDGTTSEFAARVAAAFIAHTTVLVRQTDNGV